MRLKINCDVCDTRKVNEDNYKEYEEIIISADKVIVDERSKQILSKLPFNIKADEIRSDEQDRPQKDVQNVNGVYEIGPETVVKEGTFLNVNGFLKIMPGCEEILNKYEKISINGVILCPKSITGKLPMHSITLNGMVKGYPDDYVMLDNKYKLDKYFPMRASENSGYFASTCIFDVDAETDFGKLAEKNVKFYTDKVYIRKSHLEKALQLINIEAKIVEIPDECRIMNSDDFHLDDALISSVGNNIYVSGDVTIKKDSLPALEKLTALAVDGTVKIDRSCLEKFNQLNVNCAKVVVLDGFVIEDRAMVSLDREMLENHPEGVVLRDCALVSIGDDIPTELIRERLKIRDCAKVTCADQQKSVISEVSQDVAFIGPWGVMGVFGSIFGRPGSDSSDASDTKYINADFYEL
jgi:hypothetical protein